MLEQELKNKQRYFALRSHESDLSDIDLYMLNTKLSDEDGYIVLLIMKMLLTENYDLLEFQNMSDKYSNDDMKFTQSEYEQMISNPTTLEPWISFLHKLIEKYDLTNPDLTELHIEHCKNNIEHNCTDIIGLQIYNKNPSKTGKQTIYNTSRLIEICEDSIFDNDDTI
jgi:hypothetical protein